MNIVRYQVVARTDIGIKRSINQDSLLVKHAKYKNEEIVMAIVCDGMGGLAHGELASATIIRHMSQWFNYSLSNKIKNLNLQEILQEWKNELIKVSEKIRQYANVQNEKMGSTFTGAIFYKDEYLYMHVGDSRLYEITNQVQQISEDQTFMVYQLKKGTMTIEELSKDRRRNMLMQSVGWSTNLNPYCEIKKVKKGNYLFCSDGFRHVLTNQELLRELNGSISEEQKMDQQIHILIEEVKRRKETDNISAILVHVM